MKIAIAEYSRGISHFGKAESFSIFEWQNGSFTRRGMRVNTPACHSSQNHLETLAKSAEVISDCDVVVVSGIGPAAEDTLDEKGINFQLVDHDEPDIGKILEIAREGTEYWKKTIQRKKQIWQGKLNRSQYTEKAE